MPSAAQGGNCAYDRFMTYEADRPERRQGTRGTHSARAVPYEDVASPMGGSLLAHMRRINKRNQGISRWLAVAVFVGAIVAFLFVSFLAR